MRRLVFALWLMLGAAMAEGVVALAPLGGAGATPPAPWRVVGLPAQSKPFTRFETVDLEGKRVLRVLAEKSYGNLVHSLPEGTPAQHLTWRWRVDEPNLQSDLRQRSGDDNAVEVCASFDMPLARVPFVERQVVRLVRLRSPDLVPTASICYVWDSHFATGTWLENAFTRRVRMVVLKGEGAATREWALEQRDLRADFLHAFGDESKEVPALAAISVSGDADNTQSRSVAYVDALTLEP